jgi:hypothetical protein
MSTYGRGNPEVERVIAEMNALNAVLRASSAAEVREAQSMVRNVERVWPDPRTVSDFVIRTAMARITEGILPSGEPVLADSPAWSERAFELVGLSWLAWARMDLARARFWIERWSAEASDKANLDRQGAIQSFAVALWANAVEGLVEGRQDDVRRFFNRVYHVGSNYGTESHPTVLWSMAASLTPAG